MKLETFACDVCNIQKQPSNNWWKVFLAKTGEVLTGVIVMRWDAESFTEPKEIETRASCYTPDPASAHLCGSTCLHKWMSKELFGVDKPIGSE